MSELLKNFAIGIGWAVDANSQQQAQRAVDGFEQKVAASGRTATKALLREELARRAATADTFKARVESAERLEQIDQKFGGLMLRRTLRQAAAQAKTDEERIHWLGKLSKAQDEHHQRTMTGIQKVAGVAVAAAATIQAVTIALATYATTVASKLEQMAYAADRTNSTVQDLKTFSHAVSQLGGSVGQALNDVEAFAAKFRSNPQGYTGFFRSVGVEAYDANGKLKSFTQLYKEFRAEVGKKPYEQQLLYAQEMGVSEQTWRATDPAKLAAEEEAQRAKYARMNYDPNKAAEDAKGLQHALRDLLDSLNIIGEKTASKIFAEVGDSLKSFTTFIEQHGDQIAEILSKVANMVLAVSRALLELLTSEKVKSGLDWLMGMFGHVEEGSGKWVADTEKIKLALEALATFIATIFVSKIVGGIREILKELSPLLTLLAPFAGALGIPAIGTAVVGGAIVAGSDPSKGITHGGRPDGALNPGDELPGVGGGTQTSGEGAWARAKRLSRAALGAVGLGGGKAEKTNYNFTGENADVLRQAAKELGTSPEDLATVISYESKFKPNVWGGKGGNYMGLIQFGASERAEFGANDKQSFAEQMPAVVRFLKKRGFKPGMGLMDLYSTINAGQPGLYDRSDGYGTVRSHSEKMRITERERVERFLNSAAADPAVPVPSPVLPKLQEAARALEQKAAASAERLDRDKLQAVGAATQNFRPEDYFKTAPALGSSTTNDNSTRSQSYKGGDTHVTINTHGDVRETAELWRRHGERQKADDLRHASNIFAA